MNNKNLEEIQIILRDFAGRIAYLATRNDDPVTTGNMIADDITNVAWQISRLQERKNV